MTLKNLCKSEAFSADHSLFVRQAAVEDTRAIQDLAQVIWAHTYDGVIHLDDQARVLSQSYSEDALAKSINENVFLIAELADIPIGYVDMGMQKEVLYLHRLYVSPNSQRGGAGQRLFEAAVFECTQRLKSQNPPVAPRVVAATVEQDNLKARSFYKKMGFAEESITSMNVAGVELPVIYIVKPI